MNAHLAIQYRRTVPGSKQHITWIKTQVYRWHSLQQLPISSTYHNQYSYVHHKHLWQPLTYKIHTYTQWWAAGKPSSFNLLNSLQLIFCCSCSMSGRLDLVRLFLLQVCFLQFCLSDLFVYLNCSTFLLSSFFHSSPVSCFSSNFSSDSFRCFWVWSH